MLMNYIVEVPHKDTVKFEVKAESQKDALHKIQSDQFHSMQTRIDETFDFEKATYDKEVKKKFAK